MRIEFFTNDTGLTRDRWVFVPYAESRLVLDLYSKENRETKRHHWRQVALDYYERTAPLYAEGRITEADIPLTDEIKSQVLRLFVDQIKVCKWSEVPL